MRVSFVFRCLAIGGLMCGGSPLLGCNDDSGIPRATAGSGGVSGAGTSGASGGVPAAGGGSGAGGVSSAGAGGVANGGAGGGGAGGMPAGGTGGSTNVPSGVPYVFVGSTNGTVRAFRMDASDGSLSAAGSIDGPDGLDFIALGPDDRTLFASRDSAIAAYSYDPTSQSFSSRDDASTAGGGTFVTIDPTGTSVIVAHYDEGQISVLPYSATAGFGALTTLSPGENAHQVRVDASGRHVYVPCLGSNHVAQYNLDPALGTLSPASPPTVSAPGGPRHMDFHPLAAIAYVLSENSSQIHVYDVGATSGLLSLRASGSVYTAADGQYHWSSDVHVTPDARFLYATNRDPSEVVSFAIGPDGALERRVALPLDGVVRAFAMDPAGRYLQIGGDDGQVIALRIDGATGALTRSASTPNLGNVRATIIRYLQ